MTESRAQLHLCRDLTPLDARGDDALMQLAASGVERAFETLVRRHEAHLRAYCARWCGSVTGQEVAQEVLVAIWQQRASYQPRGQFRSYLFTAARRRCQNHGRALRTRADKSEFEPLLGTDASQLDGLIARERQRHLTQRLAQLSREQREAILLHFAADLDYAEIAEVVKRPVATIRTRVFLGIRRLRALARKEGGQP